MEQKTLNKKLYDAVTNTKIDLAYIEDLLKLGADPLGSGNENNPNEYILGELFCEATDNLDVSNNMPQIVQLFYNYGMDIESINIPDDGHNINPLWMLQFVSNENGLKTLRIMLDNGLDYNSAEILVDHIFTDMDMCDGCDIDDTWFLNHTICSLKKIMLVASYPRIIEDSEYIRRCIELENNNGLSLDCFRSWNDFDYNIDISTCTNIPYGLQNAAITIVNKKTGNTVWTFFA